MTSYRILNFKLTRAERKEMERHKELYGDTVDRSFSVYAYPYTLQKKISWRRWETISNYASFKDAVRAMKKLTLGKHPKEVWRSKS